MKTMSTLVRCVAAMLLCVLGCDNGGDDPTPALELGEPCEASTECASELCLAQGSDQVCVQPCADEQSCPDASSCRMADDPDSQGQLWACLPDALGALGYYGVCSSPEDCATGLCYAGRCTELCEQCGADARCEQVSLAGITGQVPVCVPDFAAPAVDFGPVDVTESGSEELTFEVPEGTLSFLIVAEEEGTDPTQRVGIISVVAPDDTILYDRASEQVCLNPAANFYPGATSMLVPATDDDRAWPQQGTYRLRVGLFETDYVTTNMVAGQVDRVTVVLEQAGHQGGVLDVNLFFSPATGITAEEAGEHQFVQNLLNRFEQYFGGVFRLGHVVYADIPEDYDTITAGEQVLDLCASHSQPGPREVSLNVFLVRSIEFTSGMAGGAPGPAGVFGTAASGIVLQRMDNAAQTAAVLAHETGHFLGLKHTTLIANIDGENQVVGGDPILDTPQCAPNTTARDCPDYHNLMFPFFPFNDLSLTEGQIGVIAGHPMLHERDVPESCSLASATFDISDHGLAAGSLVDFESWSGAGCSPAGPARVHRYQVGSSQVSSLSIAVTGYGFDPTVSVFPSSCEAEPLVCETGTDGELTLAVEDVSPEEYFIVVAAEEGEGGAFDIVVSEPD